MALVVKVGTTTITESFAQKWYDPRRGPGHAEITLANDDTQNSLLELGTLVSFYLDATLFMLWNVENIRKVSIDGNEAAGQITVYSGRSTLAQLERSCVFPATGIRDVDTPIFAGRIGTKPYDYVRHMGAPDPSYDHTAHDPAVEALPAIGAFMPEGWRDNGAVSWIWSEALTASAHPAGKCYLWSPNFTTTGVFSVDLDFAMLDGGLLYMDGVLVGLIDPVTEADGGRQRRTVTVETTDGAHSIMAIVSHQDAAKAGGLLCAVYEHGTSDVLLRSDDSWFALGYPSTLPGLTPGAIGGVVFDESVARDELDGWTRDFTDTQDTGGTNWPTIPGDVPLQVGDTVHDVSDQLTEGWWEYAALPSNGGDVLSAWLADGVEIPGGGIATGRGEEVAVEIEIGVNAVEVVHEQVDVLATVILGQWGDGHIEGQFDDAVTAYGRRVAMLRITDVTEGEAALWAMYATLAPIAEPGLSITVKYDPVDDTDTPYKTFWPADKITAPSMDGGADVYPVAAIGGEVDDVGNIDWTVELSTAQEILQQIWQRWLSRNNNGTLGGRSRSASPSSPSITSSQRTVDWIKEVFSGGGLNVATLDDIGDPAAFLVQCRVVKLELRAVEAGVSDTTLELYRNGSATGDSVTLGDSEVLVTAYPSAGEVYEIADFMWPKVTAEGGHSGVNLTVWLAATGA